ncbi:hypothetical protein VNI00_018040 [Paramarasmius palmivorus]|uniref:Uncharacterized protein n=1 Tax=Paramarasmius palmivorus TaxID=297713 RepID=A0AAW0B522_9AGAR
MGLTLLRRYRAAVSDRAKHVAEHTGLTANLDESIIARWEAMCLAWEKAPTPKNKVANPFAITEEFFSVEKALAELALEEEARIKAGGVQYHRVDATGFVVLALDIKDTQLKMSQAIQEQQRTPTPQQSRKLAEQRTALRRRIRAYEDLRPIYMPGLTQHLETIGEDADTTEELPEKVHIWLPSDLSADSRGQICTNPLAVVESRLQFARCHDALHGLRHTLRVKTRMMLFKNINIRGQRESHRSWDIINRVVGQIQQYATHYRASRSAYGQLVGPGEWQSTLRVLKNEDIRSYRDPAAVKQGPGRKGTNEEDEGEEHEMGKALVSEEEEVVDQLFTIDRTQWKHRTEHGTGETRKGYSWIWHSGGKIDLNDGADEADNEILRSEWCKSRARSLRATEEVLLLREEMRRTLRYLEWMAGEWEARANVNVGSSSKMEGKHVFALAQAEVQRGLKTHFEKLWAKAFADERAEQEVASAATLRERDARERDAIARAGEDAARDEFWIDIGEEGDEVEFGEEVEDGEVLLGKEWHADEQSGQLDEYPDDDEDVFDDDRASQYSVDDGSLYSMDDISQYSHDVDLENIEEPCVSCSTGEAVWDNHTEGYDGLEMGYCDGDPAEMEVIDNGWAVYGWDE